MEKFVAAKRLTLIVVAMLPLVLAGTYWVERTTLDQLTGMLARSDAADWAAYLATDNADHTMTAGAAAFPDATDPHLDLAGLAGFAVFDPAGGVIHDAMLEGAPALDPATAARAAATGTAVGSVGRGDGIARPGVYSIAYAPIVVGGDVAGVVVTYMDETSRYAAFVRVARPAEAALYGVLLAALFIPGAAWLRQLRHRREADAQLVYLADHDGLTGIANRRRINDDLEAALADLPLNKRPIALHSLDIDNFKDINDTLGHDAGDLLIKTTAKRLQDTVGRRGKVGRLGGDEFVVIQDDGGNAAAAALAAEMLTALNAPYLLNDHEIALGASIGIAVAPEDGTTAERLLKSADLALYKAKGDGRGTSQRFLPEFDADLMERLNLERAIRYAVANNALTLQFQPLYSRQGKELKGFEALVRIVTEDGSLLPPTTFIPMAEKMGLIDRIGTWVLREACRAASGWPEPLVVAVNLSPAQFANDDLVDKVKAALADTGLASSRLELEITEGLLMTSTESILAQLHKLRDIGVAIVMDDFGTGYSSLSYLWRFPFDRIKIDGSFMNAIDSTEGVEKIMKTIVALGRQLRMKVTVEGVENSTQAAFLNDIDCDVVQGFFYGRPQPGGDLAATILNAFRKEIGEAAAQNETRETSARHRSSAAS